MNWRASIDGLQPIGGLGPPLDIFSASEMEQGLAMRDEFKFRVHRRMVELRASFFSRPKSLRVRASVPQLCLGETSTTCLLPFPWVIPTHNHHDWLAVMNWQGTNARYLQMGDCLQEQIGCTRTSARSLSLRPSHSTGMRTSEGIRR